jgi:hypothetical protein
MIQVYRNLHFKERVTFSVREAGLVRGYTSHIALANARFKHATPKQIQDVRQRKRYVCQWISGVECEAPADTTGMRRLCCDPKKADGFVDALTGERVSVASLVVLTTNGTYYR